MLRKIFNIFEVAVNTPHEASHLAVSDQFVHPELFHLNSLFSAAPCFPVKSSNIGILTEPRQFYDTLLLKCSEAKMRITLASLYLGNGNLEQNIVTAIRNNKSFERGDLTVNVLLDYTRGSRFTKNSRTVLLPLLQSDANCRLSMYHTPVLRGLRKKLAPTRWNELFGLQHMKLYIFDDTLIISGANLSSDYFTNRQDRYFVINDKQLCNFYCGLVDKVQTFSLRVDKNNEISLSEGWTQLPYKGSHNKFVERACKVIERYLFEFRDKQNSLKMENYDTWIFPLVQMGQLGIEHDASITNNILRNAPFGSQLLIATSYFNLTHRYMHTIMYDTKAECRLLMAHPDANGFKGAKGLAGGIPDAYSLIAQNFRNKLKELGQESRVTLHEYLRKDWTYHAKGLWYYASGSKYPSLTLIGSPNFGERSVKRDLETQVAVVTRNIDLQKQLHNECTELYERSLPAVGRRVIPKWVYVMVFLFREYF